MRFFICLVTAAIAGAQSPPQMVNLNVGLENDVEYQEDVVPSQYATIPGVTPSSTPPNNFLTVTLIGDITSVNGQPAKGTYIGRTRVLGASPNPPKGLAIADVTRTALREHTFEIQQSDGTPVGTIMSIGFSGGPPPPGQPATDRGNWVIVGGTGAYFGARGTVGGTGTGGRAASMSEDPSNRRINGGMTAAFNLHIIPASIPRIVSLTNGPAVYHSSDFSLVSSTHPAAPNETVSIYVTGLGPTVPSVDAGQPFPASPPAVVNSPLTVTVNGENARVLAAVGFSGSTDTYQINFQMPADAKPLSAGVVPILVSAAWIPGAPFNIYVQASQ
ncbi:MAG TPA: hypothetical protein VGL72_15195 [Bryobacteraceae bacterium]|jgi:hypothetical protein